jgi:hypothetical protein
MKRFTTTVVLWYVFRHSRPSSSSSFFVNNESNKGVVKLELTWNGFFPFKKKTTTRNTITLKKGL